MKRESRDDTGRDPEHWYALLYCHWALRRLSEFEMDSLLADKALSGS